MNRFLRSDKESGGILIILLILLCTVGIVAIIELPKRLQAKDVEAEYLCHEYMTSFMDAEISFNSMYRTYTDSLPALAQIREIPESCWVCPSTGKRYIINLIKVGRIIATYEIKCNGGGHGDITKEKKSWE